MWTQGCSSDKASTFVIDGAVVCNPDLTDIAYAKLCHMDKMPAKHKKMVNILCRMGVIPSAQYKLVHKKGEGIFFKSVYKSQDDQGRNIAYMFYSKSDDVKIAYENFVKFSILAKRELFGGELKPRRFLFKLKSYLTFTTITAAAIIISLWKILN